MQSHPHLLCSFFPPASPPAANTNKSPIMSAPSSDAVDEVEVDAEVLDLGVAADLDPSTYRVFFSDGDAAGAESSWPAAEGTASTLTNHDHIVAICRRYGIPGEYTPVCAGRLGASTTPAEGSGAMCVYAAALEAGMRFPLHGFYVKVLRHFRLAPSQLAPNSWTYMAAFVLLCEDAGVEPLLSVFRYFFSICAHKVDKGSPLPSGWHHFQPLRFPDGSRRLFTGHLSRKFGWKGRFFFLVSSPSSPAAASWKCPVRWGKPRRADVRRQQLTDDAIKKLLARAGKTGIDIKEFLSTREFPVDGGARIELPAPAVKTEGRAAAAATQSASTGKRKSPEVPATPPLPQPQQVPAAARPTPPGFATRPTPPGFATAPTPPQHEEVFAVRSTPPGFAAAPRPRGVSTTPRGYAATPPPPGVSPTPRSFAAEPMPPDVHSDHQRTVGAQGCGELSLPPGIWASEALQLWETITAGEREKTLLQDELRAANGEVAKLKGEVSKLNKERALLMDHLSAAVAKINRLEEDHARLKDAAAKEVRDAEVRAKKKAVLALFPNLDPTLLELSKLD